MYLNCPIAHTIQLKEISGGNCLFRCFSNIFTDNHYDRRILVMRQISHLLVGSMLTEVGEDRGMYIYAWMCWVRSYGTSNENGHIVTPAVVQYLLF